MPDLNRRRFLQTCALGLAAGLEPSLRADPLGLPIGLQLYTVRDACQRDLPGTLEKVARIGYREVEPGSFDYYHRKPGELRKLFSDRGLRCTSASYHTTALREGWERHLAGARQLGVPYVVCASLDPPDRNSLDSIRRSAELFNQAGEQAQKAGLRLAYHCHNFDFAAIDGKVGYDELLERTDPKFVDMEMDCFWTTMAGQDPVAYFNRFPGRFALLHVKDLKPGFAPTTGHVGGGNPFAEVGKGTINWRRIFAAARQGGLKHYSVEQDQCDRSPFESIKLSYDFLHKLTV